MTTPQPLSESEVERAVRAVLNDDARQVDVEANYTAIMRRLAADEVTSEDFSRPWLRAMSPRRLSVAAVLLLALGFAWWASYPQPSSAYALLTATQSPSATGADRCYRVLADVPKWWGNRNPLAKKEWETLLWTRGDRFCGIMKLPGHELVWGQDEQRNIWLVRGPRSGLSYRAAETPPMLARARTFLCLDLARLTNRFLDDFELTREKRRPDDGTNVAVIRATAKAERPIFNCNSARLVIDLATNVIRQMDLQKIVDGKQIGKLTFILVERSEQPDSYYRLTGHLEEGAEILTGEQAAERAEAFDEMFKELTPIR